MWVRMERMARWEKESGNVEEWRQDEVG